MGCKNQPCKLNESKCPGTNKDKNDGIKVVDEKQLNSGMVKEKGRIQYFYHSPSSKLPVRDALGEQGEGFKTEPHIEIEAENYLSDCRQTNIVAHLNREEEKYLFLVTTCRNKEEKGKKYYEKPFVVGYIVKEKRLQLEEEGQKRMASRGRTFIFPFSEGIPFFELFNHFSPMRIVDEQKTKIILDRFKGKRNILHDCVKEIDQLDEKNDKIHKTCLMLRVRGGKCEFQNECLRWNK
jgi:hypothetical protein